MPNMLEIIENDSTPVEDIKEVPPLPVGTYLAQIVGDCEFIKSSQKQTDGLQFNIRLLNARDDVNAERLATHLEASNRTLTDVMLKYVIWDSPYWDQNLKRFLTDTLEIPGSYTRKQSLSEVPGKQLNVSISNRTQTGQDGTVRLVHDIASTARAL